MAVSGGVVILLVSFNLVTGTAVNVGEGKPTWMSSQLGNYPASRAVDGDTTAEGAEYIIHTAIDRTNAWWKVDLQAPVQSAKVTLYLRTDYKGRRNGMQLYTSRTNSSDPKEGNLCHAVTGSPDGTDIPDVLNVNCPGTWRYLTVYTETNNSDPYGVILNFAEVQVWTCVEGKYGPNCDRDCSSRYCKLFPSACDRTGVCPSGGCQDGWMGSDCSTVCTSLMYGPNCVSSCSDRHCKTPSSTCDGVSGLCPGGCKVGWTGVDCITTCSTGKYGANCAKECNSRHCKTSSTTCDRFNGACPTDGCENGWMGPDCTIACSTGKYGANCAKDCNSRHCKTSPTTCDRFNGACPTDGCDDGWMGPDCTIACTSLTYGPNCVRSCSDRHCKTPSSTCDVVSGECPGGCEDGWTVIDCYKRVNCPDGSYGPGCTEFCNSRNCKTPSLVCDITGSCTDGCLDGWQNADCRIPCSSGTYGSNCSKSCDSRQCKTAQTTCDHESGACTSGCREGWIGADCIQRCKPGTYGPDCSRCGYCDVTCNVGDGRCPGECLGGFTGDRCDVDIRASAVTVGVIGGAVGVAIGIVAMLLLGGGLFMCLLKRGRLTWNPSNGAKPTEGRKEETGYTAEISTRTPSPGDKDPDYTELNEVTKERREKSPYDVIQNQVYENNQI